jgi:hypothetical protein
MAITAGGSDTQLPVGRTGLVRFSPDLQPDWSFPLDDLDDLVGPIDDCYALNVTDDAIWTCYYSDFPVVRIRDGGLTTWRNEVKGAKALAFTTDRAALYGGHGPDRDRLAITELVDRQARLVGEYRVVLPDGQPIPPQTGAIGRGSRLHFLTGDRWYQLDIASDSSSRHQAAQDGM